MVIYRSTILSMTFSEECLHFRIISNLTSVQLFTSKELSSFFFEISLPLLLISCSLQTLAPHVGGAIVLKARAVPYESIQIQKRALMGHTHRIYGWIYHYNKVNVTESKVEHNRSALKHIKLELNMCRSTGYEPVCGNSWRENANLICFTKNTVALVLLEG